MIGAFFRLGFITACSALVYGLILLADHAGFWVAFAVGGGGLVAAVVLSEDWSQPAEPSARRRRVGHRPWRKTSTYTGEE